MSITKQITLNLFMGAIITPAFCQVMTVSTPISIPSAYGNYHPQIEMTNDNVPAVLWTSPTLQNLYFSRHNGVNVFDTPLQLNPPGLPVQSYNWSGPDLAVWQDNIYVVFKEYGYSTGHVFLVKSTDNGISFGDTVKVDNLMVGYANYPDVAVHNDTVYVTFMDHDAGGLNPQYVVSRSVDGGATFEPAVDAGAILGDEACDCCQPEIVANDKYVIVLFRNNDSNIRDAKAVVSYDRGATFSNWISVDDHLWNVMACPSSGPDAVFSDTDIMVTSYRSRMAGVNRVFINEYDLLGDSTIITSELSLGTGVTPNYPQITFSEGKLGAVWEGRGADPDIFFNWSTTGVSGLDSLNIMNITDTSGTQSKPDICYGNGMYHIVWAEGASSGIKYVTVSEALSTNEMLRAETIKIYPNPTDDNLTVKIELSWPELFNVEVVDTRGALLIKRTISGRAGENIVRLDVEDLSPGIYFIQLTSQGMIGSKKLIKH